VLALAAATLLLGGPGSEPSRAAWAEQAAALALYGGGFCCAFVPSLPVLQGTVEGLGEAHVGLMAGAFTSVYHAGEAVGPLLSPPLVHVLGFRSFATGNAAALAAAGCGSVALLLARRHRRARRGSRDPGAA